METSPTIGAIAAALIIFHKEVGVVKKSETNPFFKSKYADLSAVITAIDEPLEKAGLAYTQFPTGQNELTTMLMHAESGEWIKGSFTMTPTKNDPQGQGSVITYQRRYALGAILGLNIDEDDDGNKASAKVASTSRIEPSTATTALTLKEQALNHINDAKTVSELNELNKKLNASKKLTNDEKTELAAIIMNKLDKLDPLND